MQPKSGGAVTADSSCCANGVEPSPPPAMWARFTTYPSSPQLPYNMTRHYNKTDRLSPTTRKLAEHNSRKTQESAFAQTTNIHTANIIFTNIILMEDKHNIPKGKMHSNYRLLPDHMVCKIIQRDNIRSANTCDPAFKVLNEEITSAIQKHKQSLWKEHLDAHWDHWHNTHGRPYMVYTTEHLQSTYTKYFHKIQQNSIHPHTLRIVSPNNSQTLSNMQQDKQIH